MAGFASWLFGLPVQQPREYRRLMRIRSRVYTPVARLAAEIIRSAEPIPFDDLDRTAFRPLRPGTRWGTVFDCAWLRITGDVPAGVENPVVMLGIRGEGLVYSPDGELLDSVSTVFQQGDLPQSGGRYRPVRERRHVDGRGRVLRRRHLQRLDPLRGRPRRSTTARISPLATTRPSRSTTTTSRSLVLAGATEDAALDAELRRALRDAYGRFAAGDVAGARAALAEQLSAPSTSEFVYSAVGHGHLDMAWLWPLRETRRKAARTLRPRPQHDRPARRLHLRHLPAAADGVDEAAASGALRADAPCRRRWPHGAAGLVLGGARHEPAVGGVARAAGAASAAGSSRRSSGSPTTSCGSAGCPTPSATTATCRRSFAEPGWTGSRPSSSRGTRSTTSRIAASTGRGSTDPPCSCTCPRKATTTAAGRPTTCSPA